MQCVISSESATSKQLIILQISTLLSVCQVQLHFIKLQLLSLFKIIDDSFELSFVFTFCCSSLCCLVARDALHAALADLTLVTVTILPTYTNSEFLHFP